MEILRCEVPIDVFGSDCEIYVNMKSIYERSIYFYKVSAVGSSSGIEVGPCILTAVNVRLGAPRDEMVREEIRGYGPYV